MSKWQLGGQSPGPGVGPLRGVGNAVLLSVCCPLSILLSVVCGLCLGSVVLERTLRPAVRASPKCASPGQSGHLVSEVALQTAVGAHQRFRMPSSRVSAGAYTHIGGYGKRPGLKRRLMGGNEPKWGAGTLEKVCSGLQCEAQPKGMVWGPTQAPGGLWGYPNVHFWGPIATKSCSPLTGA